LLGPLLFWPNFLRRSPLSGQANVPREAEEAGGDDVLGLVLEVEEGGRVGAEDEARGPVATVEVLEVDFGGGALATEDETVLRREAPGMNSLLPA
jgi:hypothetical protein